MPKIFDIWFSNHGLALLRYVDTRKLIVLIAAQQIRSAATVQNRVMGLNIPQKAAMPPKRSRLGMESSRGANAMPMAYEIG